jgi:hypothetical protein
VSALAPTIEAVDALLAAWEERLRRMDENLIALEGDAAYQILAGKAGRPAPLLGVTAERVHPALEAVTDLFEQRDALADVVARARAARASISALTFWDRDEKLALVVRLLRARSIDGGVRSLPLAERSLLDEAERDVLIEPEALLAAMVLSFERARDVILAVASAWRALTPAIEALQRELVALRAIAGEADAGELAEADRELTALAGRAQKDPLGCVAPAAPLAIQRLDALRSRLANEAATATRVAAGLDHARSQRRALADVHARAEAAFAAAARAVDDAAGHLSAPLDAPRLGELDAWLAKLTSTAAARRYAATEVGLARFSATAEGYLASDQHALAQAVAALGAREELQGRLSARRAQAAALAARAGIDPTPLEAWARDAERLLRAPPIPLGRATRAVEAYEAAVLALIRR